MQFLFKQRCMALPLMWALKHSRPRPVDSTVRGHAHDFIVLKARRACKSINKPLPWLLRFIDLFTRENWSGNEGQWQNIMVKFSLSWKSSKFFAFELEALWFIK